MFDHIGTTDWLTIPIETRMRLVEVFNIKRSGGTHVVGGVVKTDGYTDKDLSQLNIEALKAYTGLPTDNFIELFNATLIKIYQKSYAEEKEAPLVGEPSLGTPTETSVTNEGKSEEPVVPVASGITGDSGRSENDPASDVSGDASSVQQPTNDPDSGKPKHVGKGGSKKQKLPADGTVAKNV